MGSTMLRKIRASLVAASLIIPTVASALNVGAYHVYSHLNQPLDVRIQISDLQGLDEHEIVARLAAKSESDKLGIEFSSINNGLRFAVTKLDYNHAELRITSREAVREPIVSLLIEYAWPRGRLFREYNLMIDPPVYASVATTTQPPRHIEQPITRTTAPVTRSSAGGQGYTIRPNDTLSLIATRHRPSERVSVEQTMLAIRDKNPHAFINNNINLLKGGVSISLPTESEAMQITAAKARAELQRQVATKPPTKKQATASPAKQEKPVAQEEPIKPVAKQENIEPAENAASLPESAAVEAEPAAPLTDNDAAEVVDALIDEPVAVELAEEAEATAQATEDEAVDTDVAEAAIEDNVAEAATEEAELDKVEAATEDDIDTPEAVTEVGGDVNTAEAAIEDDIELDTAEVVEPFVDVEQQDFIELEKIDAEEAVIDLAVEDVIEPAGEESLEYSTEQEVAEPTDAGMELPEEPVLEEATDAATDFEAEPVTSMSDEDLVAQTEAEVLTEAEALTDVEDWTEVSHATPVQAEKTEDTTKAAAPTEKPEMGSEAEQPKDTSLIKRILSSTLFLMVLVGLLLLFILHWLVGFWRSRQQEPEAIAAEEAEEAEPTPVNLAALKDDINVHMREERYAEAIPLLRTAIQHDSTHIGLKKSLLEALYHSDKKAYQQEVTKLKGVNAELDTYIAAQADSGSTAQYAGLGAVPVVTETIVAESEEEDADAAAQNVAEPTVSEPPVELQTSAPEVVMEEEASLHNEGLPSEPNEEALSTSENILSAEDEAFFAQEDSDLDSLLAEIEGMDEEDLLGDTNVPAFLFEDDDYSEHDTGLGLARALIDMGSTEEARDTLEEILRDGTAEQKAKAQKMLDEVNN